MHTNSVVVLDMLVKKTLHQAVCPEGFFYLALSDGISTRRPSLVRRSIGLKNFTSPGLKNINLIVERLLLILKGYPVRMIRSRMM